MSCDSLEELDTRDIPIGKLIIIISRAHTLYLNHHLDKLNINASQLPLLFEISNGINQSEIASRCIIDKGAVARSIKKLEDKGLISRTIDENNRRQNKISLTAEGEEVLFKSKEILNNWENEIFDNFENKESLRKILKETAINSIAISNKG